jgi:hypothetical protein
MQKKTTAVSIREAAEQSPVLARLSDLIAQSRACMDKIAPCLPVALRKQISGGPIEADTWCLLAHNSAVASKLRQLKPDLERQLQQDGASVKYIRIRVITGTIYR